MKTILFIIQKEFKQIFRNKSMLPIIFILPLLQLVILSNAASFEVKNIKFSYIDHDRSAASRELVSKFQASNYFDVLAQFPSKNEANLQMQNGHVDVILEIPIHFERNLIKQQNTNLSVSINAIDGAAAGVSNVYITQIISGFNQSIQTQLQTYNHGNFVQPENIMTIPSFWYNKTLNYKTFMVPGILVLLVTMLSLFLSSMNIVREKEVGTLEQINVTPIKKHQFIIGKLFPFWVLGLVILTVGLIIAKVIFNVPILGNIFLIYGFTSVYLILILGIGLFISNHTETQQQAMFIAWFFTVIFILMSGLFTPIESMPTWAQNVTYFNPIRYFVEVIRMVMLKGAGFNEIKEQMSIIAIYAFVINGFAVWSYRKTN
ncbi:MAG TPA: ABC transporter permease [Flavobacterium sp.]|jgi:ABC-2 type transport system permease protein|nr:ABC transporter permease [Flavobacterium sp.]MBP6146639.1 ABC transporter permease [Flavobacterium sp.]MBP7317682.1 ABC transporter permease [Flavobacterium sp.]HRL70753.1 ABC transporter permease [Flavobacterium sp.]HRM12707.1 ABC transporter permease [Flavobacterium sp.]